MSQPQQLQQSQQPQQPQQLLQQQQRVREPNAATFAGQMRVEHQKIASLLTSAQVRARPRRERWGGLECN